MKVNSRRAWANGGSKASIPAPIKVESVKEELKVEEPVEILDDIIEEEDEEEDLSPDGGVG